MDAEAIGRLSIGSLKSILFTNHVAAGQVLEKAELVRKVVTLVDDERRERERQRQIQELEEMERLQREQERRDEADRRAREQTEQQRRERAERAQQRIEEEEDPDRPGGTSQPALGTPETSPVITNPGEPEGRNESAPPPRSPPKAPSPQASAPPPPPPRPIERSGLCVVCQDEEANIAIVDCGYVSSEGSARQTTLTHLITCRHLCMCRGCSDLIMSSSRECPLCRTRIVTEARLLRIFKS
jgi:Zinc finger, C3HC4 type (RING finger)